MAILNQWLSRASFEGRLRLPDNFDLSVFDSALLDLREDALPRLLGAELLTALLAWLTTHPAGMAADPNELPTAQSSVLEALYNQLVPYLVYSVYADYIITGEPQATDTGLVIKERDSSLSLDPVTRNSLYRTYKDKANRRAALLENYVATLRQPNSCTPSGLIPELRLGASRGKAVSFYDTL